MMELLDDFYHVKNACSNFVQRPGDRPLINFLHCLGGEDINVSRFLSLFFILISVHCIVLVLKKILPLNQGERKLSLWDFFYITLHPIILFPVFYASQLSTAVTTCWALLSVVFFQKNESISQKNLGLMVFMALIGALLRLEAIIFFIIFFIAITLLKSILHEQKWHNIPFFLPRPRWLQLLLFIAIFYFFHFWIGKLLVGAQSQHEFVVENRIMYPMHSWYNTQVWANILYFKNFIFPLGHSFYGNWGAWIRIDQIFPGYSLMFIYLLSILGGIIFVLFTKIISIQFKIFCLGPLLYAIICFIFSAVPRSDWYYPVREHLATVIWLIYLATFLRLYFRDSPQKHKQIQIFLTIYLFFSTLYLCNFPYQNTTKMMIHDRLFSGDPHPFLWLEKAEELLSEKKYNQAIAIYHHIYETIPASAYLRSHRAAIFWLLGLYGGYRAYELQQDEKHSYQILKILLKGSYFVSTVACLQDTRVPLATCFKTKDHIKNFCEYLLNPNFPRLKLVHNFRIDPQNICLLSDSKNLLTSFRSTSTHEHR